MTGLLLAGVDPIDAVLIQILVMYLVLGATSLCVVVTVAAVSRGAITDSLVIADWVRTPD
jgi:putative ABC transport system permease protein